jgi:hypothetical protein
MMGGEAVTNPHQITAEHLKKCAPCTGCWDLEYQGKGIYCRYDGNPETCSGPKEEIMDRCPQCGQKLIMKGANWGFCDNCCCEITKEEDRTHEVNYEVDILQDNKVIEHWMCRDTSMITRIVDSCLCEDIQHGKEIRIRRIKKDV